MGKQLKLNIKNAQLAKALKLDKPKKEAVQKAKKPAAEKKKEAVEEAPPAVSTESLPPAAEQEEKEAPVKKRVRARSSSAFVEGARVEEKTPSSPPLAKKEEEKPEEPSPPAELHKLEKAAPPPEPPPMERFAEPRPRRAEKKHAPTPSSSEVGVPPPMYGVHIVAQPSPPKPAPQKDKRQLPPASRKAEEGAGLSGEGGSEAGSGRGSKGKRVREMRDLRSRPSSRRTESRDRNFLQEGEEAGGWRRRRPKKRQTSQEKAVVIRPKELSVRLPIAIKDLAAAMKLKGSQLVQNLFLQGMVYTLNDLLDDETVVQLLGHEFECEISIDTSEEERIQVTGKSITEEIAETEEEKLELRAPVVAFMGHVDHGKTSLIDKIRQSNLAAGEAGKITQHIGAFRCETAVGPIAILDTPGHEAFTAMRARGAEVTDVVVLVVAGDEGIRAQTIEAIQHAKAAGVTIVVALNKCDKPAFNPENVYRQLAEQELVPEAWGGSVVTINCSALTGEGISELLEMIALQAEVLELKADPSSRARGTVVESEMHKGLGIVATVLVQNGTLRQGDPLVFDETWGRVRTMRNEHGQEVTEAGPATPVAITGLAGIPDAGSEFIVVGNEREAASIAEARVEGIRQRRLQKKKISSEFLLQQQAEAEKKVLNVILRADVQGSLEALRTSLQKIESDKADLHVIFGGVGAISESDIELAVASHAVIIGFHTQVEAHAEGLIKQHKVEVRLHDIIYHAIDDVRSLMAGQLEKLAQEEERGTAEVRAVFRSSALGRIAGCLIQDGTIHRNHRIRLLRDGELIWKGAINSIRREKEDVREVKAGVECGILLDGFNDIAEGDQLQAYEITYVSQEL